MPMLATQLNSVIVPFRDYRDAESLVRWAAETGIDVRVERDPNTFAEATSRVIVTWEQSAPAEVLASTLLTIMALAEPRHFDANMADLRNGIDQTLAKYVGQLAS
jgi:hypothetical protein